jgi:hypothetical protein
MAATTNDRICVNTLVELVRRLAASVVTALVVFGLVLAVSAAGTVNASSNAAPDHQLSTSDGDHHSDPASTGPCHGVLLCLAFIFPTRFSKADAFQQSRLTLAPPDAQFLSYPLPRIDLPPPRSTF